MNLIKFLKHVVGNQRGNFLGNEPAPEAQEGTPPAGDGVATINYPDGFDETLKGDATSGMLKNFVDDKGDFKYGDLLTSYVHAQKNIGKDKITVPDASYTEEQWKDVFKSLGLPEKDQYKIENNLPEGVEADEKMFNGFIEKAHELGVLPKQAQAIADYFNQTMGEQYKSNSEMSKAGYEKELNSFKDECGTAFEQKCQQAEAGLRHFTTPEEYQKFEESGLLGSVLLTKIFSKVGEGLNEDSFDDRTKGSFGITREDAAKEIESYYSPTHPFSIRGHPQEEFYQGRMMELQAIANPQENIKVDKGAAVG